MLRLTLAQMRRSLGRLTAAAVAVTIGTAFVTATLLASAAMTQTTYDAVTTGYADADLVVTDGEITSRTVRAIGDASGVEAVQPYLELGLELTGPRGQTYLPARAAAALASLEPSTIERGSMPSAAGEIVLPTGTAELLGVAIGDSVRSEQGIWLQDDDRPGLLTDELTVVGLLAPAPAAFLVSGGVAVVDPVQLTRWLEGLDPTASETYYWSATVAVEDGARVQAVQSDLQEMVTGGASVRTIAEQAQKTTTELTGDANSLTAVVLAFAAVALLVAGLVIANTFQVIVAQRTRTLALLRCIGADRAQLRRSVVIEALILGVAASVAGLVLGIAVVQGTLLVLNGTVTDVPLPRTVAITPLAVVLPLALGTAMTLLAGLAPARAATRVSPLAALRPSEAPRIAERSGRARAGFSLLLVVAGAAGLVAGTVVATEVDTLIGLGIGILGGAGSFIGVVLGAVFWVPRLVSWAGGLLGPRPTARLAAANTVRNPRRTAATSAALFIGVTLVAMMATGAASTRTALDQTLSEEYSIDISVGSVSDGTSFAALPAAFADQVRGIDGVARVVELSSSVVEIVDGPADGSGAYLEVRGVDPEAAASVVRAPEQVAGLTDGSVVVPRRVAGWTGIVDGAQLTLRELGAVADPSVGATTAGSPTITVTAVVTDLPGDALILTRASLDQLSPAAPPSRLWLTLVDELAAERVVEQVTTAASDSGAILETTGAAVERAFFQRVVNTLLAVVVGLLGVAVVIALVGVTNTLSLSVLERRRESATLRALGLSRAQLRGTLAIEGMLIAGVGSAVGAVLGLLYGWAGARTLLGSLADVGLTVPWRDLGLVVVVGLLAGFLASVLPGRSAARTSPVEALTVE